jgi:hypothetical protein
MKSIEARFKKNKKRNPYWSSLVQFSEAIKGKNFRKDTIKRWFNKLVEKDDYDRTLKRKILHSMYKL